ncbi:hypothetical protein GCM10020219_093760 [Nonomuraea dietziae]
MAGQQGALEVGQDGLVEAHDAGKARLARAEPGEQVLADLGLDAAMSVTALSQFTENTRLMHGFETTSPWGSAGMSFGFD